MSKTIKTVIQIFLAILFLISNLVSGTASGLEGKNIILLDDASLSLMQRVGKAEKAFDRNFKGEYFLTGYNFTTRGNNVSFGTFITSSGHRTSKISHHGDRLNIYHYSDTDDNHEDRNQKRMVVFLHRKSGNRWGVVNAAVLKGGTRYKVENLPLYLLGDPGVDESFSYVSALFKSADTEKSKKRLISVLAIHDHKEASPFLYKTASGDHGVKLRKTAIFWLGASSAERGYYYLKKLSDKATEKKIIKSLIFAFHNLNSKEGTRELIRIAKGTSHISARKDAIFWLGQRASKEAMGTLKDMVGSDESTSVKNSAIFALSQLDNDKSIPLLIDIVNKNKNPGVRKKALFWLGQKDDKRVIDLFEKLLLK